ncbi:MAG: Gfo/Idh/MocA family oxidoreductase [Verrucomicrobia bacterium]|nr:Gfo/Idh/MocA family oxidoreductase [Verrucomicrobiota bacterium]
MNTTQLDPVVSPALSRRGFLRHASLVVAGAAAVNLPFVLTSQAAPDDPIRVALIGCGGRGKGAAKDVLDAGAMLNAASPNVRIVALADIFEDAVTQARADMKTLGQDVPTEASFFGWDAYKKALAVEGVNYAILATPPGFRPIHVQAAVEAGKNVFMEKPVAVDGPGVRQIIAAGEMAKQKNLSVVAGTQRRHKPSYLETIKRIQDGAIGDLTFLRGYWNSGPTTPREESGTDMEKQVRNWYFYLWLSGDHIVEQHLHQIDVANWIAGQHPLRATGNGGRQARTMGCIWDHFAVEFEYENGIRFYSFCRQTAGCDGTISEWAHGTKGLANADGMIRPKPGQGQNWRYRGENLNPYVLEHADNIKAIRSGQPLNEARTVAESTATAILGREAAYSGQRVEFDAIMEQKTSTLPAKLAWDAPAPKVEVPIPGRYKVAA